MKTTLFAAAIFTAVFAPGHFTPLRAETPLEGRWTGTSGEMNDIPVTLTVKGASLLLEIKLPSGHAFPIRGDLSLDEAAKPHATLDIRKMKGPDDEPIPDIQGLIQIEGETLKICLSDPGGKRPDSVDKIPESGGSRMTLKRAPKK